MSPPDDHDRTRDLAIVAEDGPATGEAWVEHVRHGADEVVVDLVLEDGRRRRVPLEPERAAWLEIEPGQIVGWLRAS